MALITKWEDRGEGIITDGAKSRRIYRVGDAGDFIDWQETVTTLRTEYRGFTEAAAVAVVEANEQPTDPEDESINAWSMREDNRTVGSYTVIVDNELKEVEQYDASPIPDVGSVSFSPTQNTSVNSWPLSVTLSTSVPGAKIRYKVDQWNGAQMEDGAWQEVSGPSYNLSLNTTKHVAGQKVNGVAYHKLARVTAQAVAERQTGVYEGPQSSHLYGQRAPSLAKPTMSRGSSFNVSSWPQTVTVSTSTTNGKILYGAAQYSESGTPLTLINNTVSASNSVSVSINPTETYADVSGSRWHKYARFDARVRVEIDGIVYLGPTADRLYFAQPVPVFSAPTITPQGIFYSDFGQQPQLTESVSTLFHGLTVNISSPYSVEWYVWELAESQADWLGNKYFNGWVMQKSGTSAGSVTIDRPEEMVDARIGQTGTTFSGQQCRTYSSSNKMVYRAAYIKANAVLVLDGRTYKAWTRQSFVDIVSCPFV
jgi:hypothetical protein